MQLVVTAALPTGTVTFVFTDLEGSTKLLQELDDEYEELVVFLFDLQREAIEAGGGVEVASEGDSVFAAFESASDAVRSAVRAQRSLQTHRWPGGAKVRVRMGLHTGEGRLAGPDYMGIDVHRAARIASAAHGGQVLISSTTRALVDRALPEGVSLRDLGPHRLKDLAQPEHLCELVITGLPSDHPPLRTLDSVPHNLPLQVTSFVGRDREVSRGVELIGQCRILTVTGPGGIGKTRLSLQIAAESLSGFPDGVFFVDLSPIREPSLVPAAIGSALRLRVDPDQGALDAAKTDLESKSLLLLMDNFEQVIAAADSVAELCQSAPALKFLVTSREPLRLSGEQQLPLGPLDLPPRGASLGEEELIGSPAVRLFVDRAQRVDPDFELNANSPSIVEICRRLDGLPLAIELAASRVRLLSPPQLLHRLEDRLDVLTGGARDAPERHRTLRRAIAWSYDLLTPEEQTLFRSLSIFPGGTTLDAVELVSDARVETMSLLESLIDKALVVKGETEGEPRFHMLETIREFAEEELENSGEAEEIRRRHANYFLDLTEQFARDMVAVRAPEAWMTRLDREADNLHSALRWSVDAGEAEVALVLIANLAMWWPERMHFQEGWDWMEQILAMPEASPSSAARARALWGAAEMAFWRGDTERSDIFAQESLKISRQLGHQRGQARALGLIALNAAMAGDVPRARRYLEESSTIYRELGDEDRLAEGFGLEALLFFVEGDYESARQRLEAFMTEARKLQDLAIIAFIERSLGHLDRMEGDLDLARRRFRSALAYYREQQVPGMVAMMLDAFADLAVVEDQLERAIRLDAASRLLRHKVGGYLRFPIPLEDPKRAAQDVLDDATIRRLSAEGEAMSLGEAAAYALSDEP